MEGGKKTKGKQKVEIKKIESKEDRSVTFSKRRAGVYTKASELGTLTGAKVGVVIFSEADKPYAYGNPSVKSVISRFQNQNQQVNDDTNFHLGAQAQERINALSQNYNNLLNILEVEKSQKKSIKEAKKAYESNKGWWETSLDGRNAKELEEINASFSKFQEMLSKKINENK